VSSYLSHAGLLPCMRQYTDVVDRFVARERCTDPLAGLKRIEVRVLRVKEGDLLGKR
jgi:hypothetical protein